MTMRRAARAVGAVCFWVCVAPWLLVFDFCRVVARDYVRDGLADAAWKIRTTLRRARRS